MLSHESKIIIDYLNIHKQPSEPRQGEQKVLTRFVNEVDQYLRLKRCKSEVKMKHKVLLTNKTSHETNFFPRQVQEYIRLHFHPNEIEEYSLDKVCLEVLLYKEKSHSPEIFRTLALYLNTILEILFNHTTKMSCQQLRLFLIPTLLQKYTTKSLIWNPESINNAFSIHGKCDSIVIYRLEELLKVSIHESIHVLNLDDVPKERYIFPFNKKGEKDFSESLDLNDPYQATVFFENKFFLTSQTFPILFKEAYTETWATIINAVFTSCVIKRSIIELLVLERKFVCFQVAKILYVSGFTSWSSFMKKQSQHRNQKDSPHIKQTTSLFSYFILRSALLWDLQWFFSTFSNLQFSKNNVNISFCYSYCLRIFENETFAKSIDYYFQKIADLSKSKFLFKTMRMTCVELCM